MHLIIGMFASRNRCPICRKLLVNGQCSSCNAARAARIDQAKNTRLAAELQAAVLLKKHCGLYCQRTADGCWRVDRAGDGTMRTAILHGATLLIMAEKRLPPDIWPRGTP